MRRFLSPCVLLACVFLSSCPANPTLRVTYEGNGSTGGSVPVDSALYRTGDVVTVLPNDGGLSLSCRTLTAWNTQADGAGTDYAAGATFIMGSSDVALHARWEPYFTLIPFSQCDPSWGGEYMGSSTDTICYAGSLLTSLAMMLSAEDKTVTPKTLDDYLTANSKYIGGSLIPFAAADGYGTSFRFASPTMTFSLSTLKAELDLGNPVLLNTYGGTAWCVVFEYANQGTEYGDFHFLDPGNADGDTFVLSTSVSPGNIAAYHR